MITSAHGPLMSAFDTHGVALIQAERWRLSRPATSRKFHAEAAVIAGRVERLSAALVAWDEAVDLGAVVGLDEALAELVAAYAALSDPTPMTPQVQP